MNIVEEYKNTSDKVEFFAQLSDDDKKNLYQNLSISNQKELLAALPFQYIKRLLSTYSKEDQKRIYKQLSQTQLQALYNNANEDEKKDIADILETIQVDLSTTIESRRNEINQSTNVIETTQQNINQSRENIKIAKENLKEQRRELKQNKVIIKKLERDRKRKLVKAMKAQKKMSLTKKSNQIAIISKYRKKKYLQRVQELELATQVLDGQKVQNEATKKTIAELNQTIEKEKNKITASEAKIDAEREKISYNISSIDRTETKIKKLSQTEKKILGRKLYNQKVYERDTIIVRQKQPKNVHANTNPQPTVASPQNVNQQANNQAQTPPVQATPPKANAPQPVASTPSTPQAQSTPTQTDDQDKDQTSIQTNSKSNTQDLMNNIFNVANILQQMGVNLNQQPNNLSNPQDASLMQNPITQMNQAQMIIASYAMMAFYNQLLQQQLQNQQQQNLIQADPQGHSRGFVNLPLLISIILFIFSLVLFFIK